MRSFIIAIAALALVTPFTMATAPGPVSVVPVFGETAGSDAVSYSHRDCVGPGLPGTAPPHTTHTTRVGGFVVDPAKPVTVSIIPLAPFGTGICPTAFMGPVLQEDFTGQIRLTGVCRGTINEGALFFDYTISFLSGFLIGVSSTPGTCTGALNAPFAVDLTASISQATLLGVPLGPIGGVRHTMSQP